MTQFAVRVVSMLLETLPFLVLGSLIAAIVHLHVTEPMVARLIPGNRFLALVITSSIGLVLPLCECAIVPVVRRLTAKGLPASIGIAFLLAVPIVNPVVAASTWLAFPQFTAMAPYRLALGFVGAVCISACVGAFFRIVGEPQIPAESPAERRTEGGSECSCRSVHIHELDGSRCLAPEPEDTRRRLFRQSIDVVRAAGDEFLEMGRFLVLGVTLSAVVQTLTPPEAMVAATGHPLSASIVTIGAAYFMSLCSETDAFIIRGFLGQIPLGAIMAFLVFGPMMDLKNTLLLRSVFRPKIIAVLILFTAIYAIAAGAFMHLLFGTLT
jgi:uncharacterized protein